METVKNKKKPFVLLRMNLLFLIVFLLFSVLILRLGIVQIVHGEDYKKEINKTNDVSVYNPVPRGLIFDRNGKLIVGNKPLNAITYTIPQSAKPELKLEVARKLAKLINKDSKDDFKAITERDRKDFWILTHPDEAKALITDQDLAAFKKAHLDQKEINAKSYQLQLNRITKKDIQSFTKQELEVLAIYREMNGYALTTQIIKRDVTPREFAVVSENLDKLPGVDTTIDWDRFTVFKNESGDTVLGSVLGKVTSSKEGLPKEKAQYYTALGYSRNDRVGKSYLEYQYEDVLKGEKEKVQNKTDKTGNVLESKVIRKGKRGDDLVLSIDIDLQQAVEKIIQDKLGKARMGQPYLDRTFVSVMNPRTGELLAMAGKQYVKDKETGKTEINDYALGNMNSSYSMGSAVKGATVLTGYQTGAIKPYEIIRDEPIYLKSTDVKKSWNGIGFGNINDLYALKRSSNVYMFKLAMKVGGQNYVPHGPLLFDKIETIKKFRNNFSQFGLGVKTGIDLPGESAGIGGGIPPESGKVLDFAIGQYDTYTPLQLVQYISTIANGGYRLQPHIVKEIREPNVKSDELGPIAHGIQPKILNKVDMKSDWVKHVQEGLKLVVNDPLGTAYGGIHNKQYKIAGKTGTAQSVYDGPNRKPNEIIWTWNVTFAGYAPYDNPEVALSVVVPYNLTDKTHVNLEIADAVFKAYFDLKEKREKEGLSNAESTQKVENIEDAKKVEANSDANENE
ncbi:penicillin-binding protein [Heyndrickxia shackletonii]|uniref:serine-type D-Ala-D-Ala carboxypeptidase n=1 Tax=Heyndrickxia shackletonii TaxID=157838 RepID=A0A0Q3THV2_9BACI|nr:penicillin-binding protein 2 [Heyndrickxia shackletonii]KQL53536.1 penicillin-binding protein [Heyndrickxia shackletonii]NEY99615.1 penicillin-binding protein 2 [Heyndrickxia shackletonii]